jgi:hypothetical protein
MTKPGEYNPNKPSSPPGQDKPKPGDPDYVKPGKGEGEEGEIDEDEPHPDHTLPGDQPYVDPRK